MSAIEGMLSLIKQSTIAQEVTREHDSARAGFAIHQNLVDTFAEFSRILGDYYNYHCSACASLGGPLPQRDAESTAKELLEQEYRRSGGDIVSAFSAAHDGDGGLRLVIDRLTEALKARAVERYVRDVFDRYVAPSDWDGKVEIIRQFMVKHEHCLPSSVEIDRPERYAHNYKMLVRSYVNGLRQTSEMFRSL